MTKGFFDLQTPQDLLRKLRHDSDRVKKSPMDSYAAFDLFVTAYHMLDWVHPGDSNKATRKQMESDNNILRVVSHLANGSKHFQVTRHHVVKETIIHEGAFDPNVFDSNAFDVGDVARRTRWGRRTRIWCLNRSAGTCRQGSAFLGGTSSPIGSGSRLAFHTLSVKIPLSVRFVCQGNAASLV